MDDSTQNRGHYFLSYSRADERFALKLAADIRKHEVPVWIDQVDIRPSEHWDKAIERAVRDSRGLVVILSPRSVASDNVADEISFAIDSGKSVLPVMIEKCVLPLRITRMHVVDATSNYDKALKQCLAALVPGHSPMPAEARKPAPARLSDPQVLSAAKRQLTRFLGPIAGKLVDQTAARVGSVADLYGSLAERIENEDDRKRFLAEAPVAHDGSLPERRKSAPVQDAVASADVDFLAKVLTAFLGPIAPIVARRESRNCASLADLRECLAAMIPAEEDRRAFLRQVNSP